MRCSFQTKAKSNNRINHLSSSGPPVSKQDTVRPISHPFHNCFSGKHAGISRTVLILPSQSCWSSPAERSKDGGRGLMGGISGDAGDIARRNEGKRNDEKRK